MKELEAKAAEIAENLYGMSLKDKIRIIARAFSCSDGEIVTTPCHGKWRGCSDISILFDTGLKFGIGNDVTPRAKSKYQQQKIIDSILLRYNPEIIKLTKKLALPVLLEREKWDRMISKKMGLKPYTLLNVEFNDGSDELSSGYLGWYFVSLEVEGKIIAHLETKLSYEIAFGKICPVKEYYAAGGLDESTIDYVFNNVGFSSVSGLYKLHVSEAVRERALKTLAERKKEEN